MATHAGCFAKIEELEAQLITARSALKTIEYFGSQGHDGRELAIVATEVLRILDNFSGLEKES